MTIMRKRMTTDTRNEHPSDTESGSFSFRDWLADQLRQAQTLEGGVSHSSTSVRHNDQFQNGDIRQFNLIFLDLTYCVRGPKFHCCRTISRKERPPSGDHRRTNSWVRSLSASSKAGEMCLSLCGSSKTSRMVWEPGSAARQPRISVRPAQIRPDITSLPM